MLSQPSRRFLTIASKISFHKGNKLGAFALKWSYGKDSTLENNMVSKFLMKYSKIERLRNESVENVV